VLLKRFWVLLATFFLLAAAPLAALNLFEPSPFFIAAAAPVAGFGVFAALFPAALFAFAESCPRCMAAAAADLLALALPVEEPELFDAVMLFCIAAAAPELCFGDEFDDADDDEPCRMAPDAPEL
jgi:hypothetical protein